LEEGGKFRECKGSSNRIQRINEYRSKTIGKAKYGRGKKF